MKKIQKVSVALLVLFAMCMSSMPVFASDVPQGTLSNPIVIQPLHGENFVIDHLSSSEVKIYFSGLNYDETALVSYDVYDRFGNKQYSYDVRCSGFTWTDSHSSSDGGKIVINVFNILSKPITINVGHNRK